MPTTLRAKCIIVGDATVGKTAITQVFLSDKTQFPKNYNMTLGIDLCTKSVPITDAHAFVELFIVDSPGREVISEAVQKHWDHPSMVIIVYDVTNESSFESCEKWLERVRAQNPGSSFPGVCIANKVDLGDRRVITTEMGEEFSRSKGLKYFEMSARNIYSVDEPFIYLANAFYKLYENKLDALRSMGY